MWSRWRASAAAGQCVLAAGRASPTAVRGGDVRRLVPFGSGSALDPAGCDRGSDRAADAARAVGPGGRGRGHVRPAVEGGLRGRDRRRVVPPLDADVLAAAARRQSAAAPDFRGGPPVDCGHRRGQGRNRRALDSTVLDDAVARQDTVTQLIAAVRRVAREVPGAADLVAACCNGHDYTSPGKPRIAWETKPPGRSWCRRWSTTPSRCWPRWTWTCSRRRAVSRPRRSRCWRWSPARTSSRPTGPTAPTADGGSPARPPRTG